jgi:FkbM family methyltransferase
MESLMHSLPVIRVTARATDFCFRHAFPLYARCYDLYKQRSDRAVIRLVTRLVRPGDRVADVGANVGFYSRLLARLVGESGRVYAFEPDDLNFSRLRERAGQFPQLHTVHAAVADVPGSRTLYRSPRLNVDHRAYATDDRREQVTVDAVSLDSYFASPEEPLHFVKMDIQGGEYAALRGMRSLVARSPDLKILMELWPFVHDRFGEGTDALLALLTSWGFEVRRLASDAASLGTPLARADAIPDRADPSTYFDVLCVRAGTLRA